LEETHIPGDSVLRLADHWGAVCVVGVVMEGVVLDPDGNLVSPGTPGPGWHVNVSLNPGRLLPAALDPFVIYPESPVRVFG
jgi:hypothetical protein